MYLLLIIWIMLSVSQLSQCDYNSQFPLNPYLKLNYKVVLGKGLNSSIFNIQITLPR